MAYTFDDNIISDLHKDARGVRPSQDFWHGWNTMGDDTKQSVWDMLCEELNESIEMEKQQEEKALVEFKSLLKDTMNICNCDWKNALRILIEAEGMSTDTINSQDFDHFLWQHDLGYSKRIEIREKFLG